MSFDMGRRKIYHARLMYARPFIDSLDFARNGKQVSGVVPVSELPRLQDMLESPQDILSYTVQGGMDKQGNSFLDVAVAGQCRMRCQRCLNGLDYPVRLDTRLMLCDQAVLEALDEKLASGEEEEFDSILANPHLDVLDLLEEEILLTLPIAPKHELGDCQVTGGDNAYGKEASPFEVLAKLKRN